MSFALCSCERSDSGPRCRISPGECGLKHAEGQSHVMSPRWNRIGHVQMAQANGTAIRHNGTRKMPKGAHRSRSQIARAGDAGKTIGCGETSQPIRIQYQGQGPGMHPERRKSSALMDSSRAGPSSTSSLRCLGIRDRGIAMTASSQMASSNRVGAANCIPRPRSGDGSNIAQDSLLSHRCCCFTPRAVLR